jgi:uncharacterized membrane protein HdeD (DUF308 family)
MAPLLTAQRWFTTALGVVCLLAGTLAWGPLVGLWLAAWVVGLICVGAGSVLHELLLRYQRPMTNPLTPATDAATAAEQARNVKLSGFGYLTAGMFAGLFPPILSFALLSAVLIDYLAGHHLIGRLVGS